HETAHVSFPESLLGDQAVQPCIYNFLGTDPTSFVTLSFVVHTVGVSAYSGSLKYPTSTVRWSGLDATHNYSDVGDTIPAWGAILAVQARQAAWANSAIHRADPWNTTFDMPLDLDQVFTLASPVIVSCPSTNMANAFPALLFPGTAKPGETVEASYGATS
ncbi:hypothetical protein BS17DRAFT_719339, partial [Gyrodon lividus]